MAADYLGNSYVSDLNDASGGDYLGNSNIADSQGISGGDYLGTSGVSASIEYPDDENVLGNIGMMGLAEAEQVQSNENIAVYQGETIQMGEEPPEYKEFYPGPSQNGIVIEEENVLINSGTGIMITDDRSENTQSDNTEQGLPDPIFGYTISGDTIQYNDGKWLQNGGTDIDREGVVGGYLLIDSQPNKNFRGAYMNSIDDISKDLTGMDAKTFTHQYIPANYPENSIGFGDTKSYETAVFWTEYDDANGYTVYPVDEASQNYIAAHPEIMEDMTRFLNEREKGNNIKEQVNTKDDMEH